MHVIMKRLRLRKRAEQRARTLRIHVAHGACDVERAPMQYVEARTQLIVYYCSAKGRKKREAVPIAM